MLNNFSKDDTVSLNSTFGSVSNQDSPISGSVTSLNVIDRQRNNSITDTMGSSSNIRPVRPAPAIPRALERGSHGTSKRRAPTVPPRSVLFYFIYLVIFLKLTLSIIAIIFYFTFIFGFLITLIQYNTNCNCCSNTKQIEYNSFPRI